MKILMVPMAAIAETSGPFSRTEILAKAFLKKGFQVALCAAEDMNYKPIDDVQNYPLSIPVPMGFPKFIGMHVYPIAEKFGIIGRKSVHSFEEVLHLTGTISYPYFKVSIAEIRSAIVNFKPDIVYSEFNLSALVAAKAENKPVIASYSFPTQSTYAASPQFARGVNKVMAELKQPHVKSALDLFQRADLRIVPSSRELEPIDDENTLFVGSLKKAPVFKKKDYKDCVLVYMGSGTISKKRILKVISGAFQETAFEVYIAGMGFSESNDGNIHIAHRFDFSKFLPRAAVFINHGGQNSIMDGLIYGVPQIICPGKVFERKYNADSVVKNGAGLCLSLAEFREDILFKTANRLISDKSFQKNAEMFGESLTSLGGEAAVISCINNRF